jgi:transposase
LLDGIGWQHDQGRVLTFLYKPEVEPTNNRAERALRPAVIARKVSHCSKNERGAHAFAAFTSVVRTAVKQGAATVTQTLQQLLQPPNPPGSP